MGRLMLATVLLCAPLAVVAADDLKVSQLEQDVRTLQRQLQAQAQQLEALRLRAAQPERPAILPLPAAPVAGAVGQWVDASRWQQLRTGMSELEVIRLLGPPTSMRGGEDGRVLLYALEIGTSGFLGGSVTLHDRAVITIEKPVLK